MISHAIDYVGDRISLRLKRRLPNDCTRLRFFLAAVVPYCYVTDYLVVAVTLSLVALATDWLDGRLATQWDSKSAWGAKFDPWADKVYHWPHWLMLFLPWILPEWSEAYQAVYVNVPAWNLSAWPGSVIMMTTVVIFVYDLALGIIARAIDKNMRTNQFARMKTAVLLPTTWVLLVISCMPDEWFVPLSYVKWGLLQLSMLSLAVAVGLTFMSTYVYLNDLGRRYKLFG
jgi:phosphatidylglycerophosphate synthase